MSSFTHIPGAETGTSAVFVPEVWSKELQIQREPVFYMAKRVDRFDMDFANGGDKLHVPKISDLTMGTIGNDGSLAETSNTEGEVTLTVDQWKGCIIRIPDLVKAQSRYDLRSRYVEKMSFGLGKLVEQALLALRSGLSTNSVGTAGAGITDAVFRNGVQKLDEAIAPFEDRYLIVSPQGKNDILGIDKFMRYDSIPYSLGNSPILKGKLGADAGELYGVQVMVSPLVTSSGGEYLNIMWQKSAFGLALVKDIKVEQLARLDFADRVGTSELYGVAEMRDDHGVKVAS